jgi:hypothetical protein
VALLAPSVCRDDKHQPEQESGNGGVDQQTVHLDGMLY